jgi:predicted XRE-type DNA-binding protein
MKQTEIAEQLNISQWSVSKLLNEKTFIDKREYERLLDVERRYNSLVGDRFPDRWKV